MKVFQLAADVIVDLLVHMIHVFIGLFKKLVPGRGIGINGYYQKRRQGTGDEKYQKLPHHRQIVKK